MYNVIFSGIKPSGILHIGNYFGTVMDWERMIKTSAAKECIFMIADLHSLISVHDGKTLSSNIKQLVACLMACGIDEVKSDKKVAIFQQSKIHAHTKLSWILECITPVSWLERMTQFKDKSNKKENHNICSGLLTYPLLQAADILLYDADMVPVGEDQKQHIELTRDVAEKFNREFKNQTFILPDCFINEHSKRIMSLTDGTVKMSKSEENQKSCILLTDSNDEIRQKILKAKTDSFSHISFDKENRPDVANLIQIFSCSSGLDVEKIVNMHEGKSTAEFKKNLAESLIHKIEPIRERIQQYLKNEDHLRKFLSKSNDFCQEKSSKKMQIVNEVCGI